MLAHVLKQVCLCLKHNLISWPSVIALGCPCCTVYSCVCVKVEIWLDLLHLLFRAAVISVITPIALYGK